jgi:hypothetical protein
MTTHDLDSNELTDQDNNKYQLHPHEFWYMAPKRNILLHNAVCGKGIVPAMGVLLKGIAIKSVKENPKACKAEELFEEIRSKDYSDLPSRLRCYFLSISKEVAEQRSKKWRERVNLGKSCQLMTWQDTRILTKCYLILNSGKYHLANIKEYEKAAEENDENLIKQYAGRYWGKGFSEAKFLDERIELLADSALYFPEWETFSKMELPDKPNDEKGLKLESYTEGGWKKIY